MKGKKNIEIGSYYFSFFALSNSLTQTCLHFHRTGQLNSSEHANIYYLLHLFTSLCHILYLDAAKFSINQFSLLYLTVFVVRQQEEYE